MLTIHTGDCRKILRSMPSDSIQCCVTSPPYYGLRDYGVAGQIGLEETPEEFISSIVKVFREVRRVLKPDGTCWVNMGDSYASNASGNPQSGLKALSDKYSPRKTPRAVHKYQDHAPAPRRTFPKGVKPKDIMGMPWRIAFALQADGWWLRQDIIWHKPNPMPESVSDRCTKAHEYIFLLTKSASYYYDAEAIKEKASENTNPRISKAAEAGILKAREAGQDTVSSNAAGHGVNPKSRDEQFQVASTSSLKQAISCLVETRNKRSVWTVPSSPCKEAHFATYPPDLIKPCILAGTRPGDLVLDPFGGSGTTGAVALELGRRAVLIELSPAYVGIIKRRTTLTPGLALA